MTVSVSASPNLDLDAVIAGGSEFLARLKALQDAKAGIESARVNLRETEAAAAKILADARSEAERIVAEAHSKAAEIMQTADERTARAEAARDQALAAIEAFEKL